MVCKSISFHKMNHEKISSVNVSYRQHPLMYFISEINDKWFGKRIAIMV